MRSIPVLLLLLLLAAPALASDGVVEINEACAVQAGCFPGDEPGYPVTITGTAGRSYRLTGDLSINSADTTVIEVQADDVTIHLGGFRIVCTTFVPPSTIQPCGAAGPGDGVGIDALGRDGVTIRDGSIDGMGDRGILVSAGTVEQVRVSSSGRAGISIGSGSVRGCLVKDNGETGISASGTALIRGNVVRDNGASGISAGRDSLVEGNIVTGNGSDGIFGGSVGALIRGNTTSANGNMGIRVGFQDAYSGNVARGNAMGQISGGNNLGGNYCAAADGSNACP